MRNFRYLVSSFVRHLQETHSAALGYLETIVKGHVLADAIFLPEPSSASRKFRNTEVYFDTPFLLKALGCGGEAQMEPCVELLELLYETGADLRCFAHTRDEIRGVIEACASQVQNGETQVSPSFEVLRNFRSMGYSKTDVMMFSNNLEKNLRDLRIRVVERPAYAEYESQIDEDVLRKEFESSINYSRPRQISRDVESISAIMRLRRGMRPVRLEDCRALFVTNNSALAGVAQHHLSNGQAAVSPCFTDHALTNLLWLKKPTAAPDLPRKRIIADCYAATQPTERMWRLYLREIDKLRQTDEVTLDDYYMLRNSTTAELALMEATLGQEEGFTEGTVPEILERIRSDKELAKQVELDAERSAHKATEDELEATRIQDSHRKAKIKSKARQYARMTASTLKVSLTAVLVLATAYSFGWGLPFANIPLERYWAPVALLALLIFSATSYWSGATVESIARRGEIALERWIESSLLALSEEK